MTYKRYYDEVGSLKEGNFIILDEYVDAKDEESFDDSIVDTVRDGDGPQWEIEGPDMLHWNPRSFVLVRVIFLFFRILKLEKAYILIEKIIRSDAFSYNNAEGNEDKER